MMRKFLSICCIVLGFAGIATVMEGSVEAAALSLVIVLLALAYFLWPKKRKEKATKRQKEKKPIYVTCPEQTDTQPTSRQDPTMPQEIVLAEAELIKVPEDNPLISEQRQAPEEKPKSSYRLRLEAASTKEVKLAGTASLKARQGYLRKIDENMEPFDYCSYGIRQTTYKGEPAFQVYAEIIGETTDKVLGMVPAGQVKNVLKIYDRIFDVHVDVYGGPEYEGDDKYYGASATLFYDPE